MDSEKHIDALLVSNKNIIYGIEMKPGFKLSNFFAIPLSFTAYTVLATFVNTELIFLLKSPDYFNVSSNQIGTLISDILFYCIIATMVVTLFIGQIYDIAGRKMTLFVSTIISAFFLFIIPYCQNIYPQLVIARMGIAFASVSALCIPFVTDYVKKSSRGKATAFQAMGIVLGDLLTFAVIFSITKNLEIKQSFIIATSVVVIFALLFLVIVKEPNMDKIHQASELRMNQQRIQRGELPDQHFKDMSFFKQMVSLTKAVYMACTENIILPICFIGVSIIRLVFIIFNTYMMLWITSFLDNGYLKSETQAKTLIQTYNIMAVIFVVSTIKFMGQFTDTYPYYITIPTSFLLRAFSIFCFFFLQKPDTLFAYFVGALMATASIFQNTTLDGVFNKNLPKDIRATMNSTYNFFGNVGMLIFTKIGGYLYDDIGPKAPFILVMICDLIFAILLIIIRNLKK